MQDFAFNCFKQKHMGWSLIKILYNKNICSDVNFI